MNCTSSGNVKSTSDILQQFRKMDAPQLSINHGSVETFPSVCHPDWEQTGTITKTVIHKVSAAFSRLLPAPRWALTWLFGESTLFLTAFQRWDVSTRRPRSTVSAASRISFMWTPPRETREARPSCRCGGAWCSGECRKRRAHEAHNNPTA